MYWICSGGNGFIAVTRQIEMLNYSLGISKSLNIFVLFSKPCPVGLVYNPNTKICDFPANNDTTNCITYRFFGDVQVEFPMVEKTIFEFT